MELKKTFIIATTAILLLVLVIIVFQLTFSGVVLASWVFVLLFGIITMPFLRFGSLKKNKFLAHSNENKNYFSGLNLVLILMIVAGFLLLSRNLVVNQAFNVIHVSVILYGTGLLVGNNYRGVNF